MKKIALTFVLCLSLVVGIGIHKESKAAAQALGLATCTTPTPLLLICAATLVSVYFAIDGTITAVTKVENNRTGSVIFPHGPGGKFKIIGKIYSDVVVVADFYEDPITDIPSKEECLATITAIVAGYKAADPNVVARLECVPDN